MKEDMREEGSGGSPARQLAMFISKYDPQIDKLARTARLRLRRQMRRAPWNWSRTTTMRWPSGSAQRSAPRT
jgi:hypothetical protein